MGELKKNRDLLIIEDDRNIAGLAKMLFEAEGISVDTAHNGKEAHIMIGMTDYKAISLDMNMNIMSGYEFLHCLDKNSYNKVVVFSGYTDDRLIREFGISNIFSKPADIMKYIETIKRLCVS